MKRFRGDFVSCVNHSNTDQSWPYVSSCMWKKVDCYTVLCCSTSRGLKRCGRYLKEACTRPQIVVKSRLEGEWELACDQIWEKMEENPPKSNQKVHALKLYAVTCCAHSGKALLESHETQKVMTYVKNPALSIFSTKKSCEILKGLTMDV